MKKLFKMKNLLWVAIAGVIAYFIYPPFKTWVNTKILKKQETTETK